MPGKVAKLAGKQQLHAHAFADERVPDAVVAAVGSSRPMDGTENATNYVLAVGGNAATARRMFPNAVVVFNPTALPFSPHEEICVLAFGERDDAHIAFMGLCYSYSSQTGSLWRVALTNEEGAEIL